MSPHTLTDNDGVEWTVIDLLRMGDSLFESGLGGPDASHRGFSRPGYRRLYRYRPGEDRSLSRANLLTQLAASRVVQSQPKPVVKVLPNVGESIQNLYERRGMGRR